MSEEFTRYPARPAEAPENNLRRSEYSIGGLQVFLSYDHLSMQKGVKGLKIEVREAKGPKKMYTIGDLPNSKFSRFKTFLAKQEAAFFGRTNLPSVSFIGQVVGFQGEVLDRKRIHDGPETPGKNRKRIID
jgi:hypothetical protein